MDFYTRDTPDIKNNEIYQFYHNKYYDTVDTETFYLSGIGYIYRCLDSVIASAGLDNLCIMDGNLCSECCKKQEAHVSMAEMRYFIAQEGGFSEFLDKALSHAVLDYNTCLDVFFIDDVCSVYENRFLVCRAYANIFSGELYCPRHNGEILKGEAINDIVDSFYFFIDQLSKINEDKYYGYITPTYFFIREHLLQIRQQPSEFFEENGLHISWAKTHVKQKYSIGILGTPNYSKEYQDNVKQLNKKLLGVKIT